MHATNTHDDSVGKTTKQVALPGVSTDPLAEVLATSVNHEDIHAEPASERERCGAIGCRTGEHLAKVDGVRRTRVLCPEHALNFIAVEVSRS